MGLHQLSLEDNPWHCDCRLAPLKRWLQSTRTPLNAPVRCQWTPWRNQPTRGQQINQALIATKKRHFISTNSSLASADSASSDLAAREEEVGPESEDGSAGSSFPSTMDVSNNNDNNKPRKRVRNGPAEQRAELFDQLALEDFVCAPQANLAALSSSSLSTKLWATLDPVGQLQTVRSASTSGRGDGAEDEELFSRLLPSLSSVHEYLGHTLIRYPSTREAPRQVDANQTDNNKGSSRSQISINSTATIARQHKEMLEAPEGR